jgi:hypothetical protein
MGQQMDDGISIFTTGSTITTGAASARVAIPVDSSGNLPRYIRITAINPCFIKLGDSTVVAASGDAMVQPADALILAVNGATNIAAIQQAAAGLVQISPLANL